MSQRDAAVFLQYMMGKKQKQMLDEAVKQASGYIAAQLPGVGQISGIEQIPGVSQLLEAVTSPVSGQQQASEQPHESARTGMSDPRQESDDPQEARCSENIRMSDTKIYIGLNDAETKEQKFETRRYLDVLKSVCRSYHMAFSVDIEQGGYFHEDGEYTEENSLVLTLIDADKNVVREIAKDLCAFFHQESVLITEGYVSGYYVSLPNADMEEQS